MENFEYKRLCELAEKWQPEGEPEVEVTEENEIEAERDKLEGLILSVRMTSARRYPELWQNKTIKGVRNSSENFQRTLAALLGLPWPVTEQKKWWKFW